MNTFLNRLQLSLKSFGNDFKNIRMLFYALLFLLLLIITAFGMFLSNKTTTGYKTKAAGNGIALTLIPSTVAAPAGSDFPVTVSMNTNEKTVSAAEIHLSYDPTKLKVKTVTTLDYLPVILVPATVGSGTATFILGSQPTAPKKGAGILATLTFTSFTSLPSRISFANNTQVAAIGQTSNAIDTMTGTDVNKNAGGEGAGGGGSSITPTFATPSPTPTRFPLNNSCNQDSDCRLIDTSWGYSCCYAGACTQLDYSQNQWVAVNGTWFQTQQSTYCPSKTRCGPAPGCAVHMINGNYHASCVNSICKKIPVSVTPTQPVPISFPKITPVIHCGLTVCKTGEECYSPPAPPCAPGEPCVLRAFAPYCRPITVVPTSIETGTTPIPPTNETPAPTTAPIPVPSPTQTVKPCQWYDWPFHFFQCIQGGYLVTVTPLTTPAPTESPVIPSPFPIPPSPITQHLVIPPQSQGNDQITIAQNVQQNTITGRPIPLPSQSPPYFVPPPINGFPTTSTIPLPSKTITHPPTPPQKEQSHLYLFKPITGIGFIDTILHAFGFGR